MTNCPPRITTLGTIRKRVRRCFWWHGGIAYLATRIHHTRRLNNTDTSHTLTFELHMLSTFKLKNHLIIVKYPKHPLLSQHLTQKNHMETIKSGYFLYFFSIVRGKISFYNLEKLQRHKHLLLAVYFILFYFWLRAK